MENNKEEQGEAKNGREKGESVLKPGIYFLNMYVWQMGKLSRSGWSIFSDFSNTNAYVMCELSENQQNKSRQEWDSQSQMKLMVLDGAAHVL